jgi:hypothetical protein
VRLTGRELNLGGYPSPPDLTPPRTRLNSCEQPAGLVEALTTQRIGGETQQGVCSGTVSVDPVRIATTRRPNAREGGAVEGTGEVVSPELTVVRRARRQGQGRDHRVGLVTERVQDGGGRRVVALASEDDGGEPPDAGVGSGQRGPDVAIG